MPAPTRRFLVDRGSLTAALQAACPAFSVRGVAQFAGRPARDEVHVCRLKNRERAVIREVFLFCGETPVVFAHSVLPAHSLKGAWRALHDLGNRPLGAALFSNPRVRRAPLSFRRLPPRHPLARRALGAPGLAPGPLWARRSAFYLNRRVILVTEVFLPAIGVATRCSPSA